MVRAVGPVRLLYERVIEVQYLGQLLDQLDAVAWNRDVIYYYLLFLVFQDSQTAV